MSLKKEVLASLLIDSKPGFASGDDLEEGVFQIRMNNITRDGALDVAKRRRVSLDERKLGSVLLDVGDVLFNATNSPDLVGKSAYVGSLDEPTTYSNHFVRLRADPKKLDGSYLARWLHTLFQAGKFKGLCKQWVNQATVSRDSLLALEMPLPPLSEQRRIAAILDKADALRTKRREALVQLDRLAQSIFVEMFGEASPHKQKPLQDLCDLITDGTHQTPTYADEGVIFLSAKNVTSGEIDWAHVKYIPQSLHIELHRRLAPKVGDILLAKNGTTGVAAVVDRDCIFDIYVSLALLRPRADVHPKYLLAAINSPACKRQFNGSLKGIGVPNLHLKEIRQALVPSPSQDEQREFVRRLDSLADLKRNSRDALFQAESLFASLQHRAFRGEL